MEDYSIAAYIYGMNCIFVDHSPCSSVVIVSANDTGSYNPSTSALNDDYFGPYTMAWSGSEPELDSNGNALWITGKTPSRTSPASRSLRTERQQCLCFV